MSSFIGKVVLISGASSGIGEGTAIHFAKLKAKLSLLGRNAENLEKVSKQCQEAGLGPDEVLTVAGDINDGGYRQSVIDKTIEKFGKLDVLNFLLDWVNNAGLMVYKSVGTVIESEYDEIMNTNTKSQVLFTQLALPHLIKSKGCIVNNSSICGSKSMPIIGAYCMSKAAMDMFTKCLALEMAPQGVRVNAISPGSIVSSIYRRPNGPYEDDAAYNQFLEKQKLAHPLGRVGIPEDCAEAIAFLASDSASFITGQILYIDGGRNCVSVGIPAPK